MCSPRHAYGVLPCSNMHLHLIFLPVFMLTNLTRSALTPSRTSGATPTFPSAALEGAVQGAHRGVAVGLARASGMVVSRMHSLEAAAQARGKEQAPGGAIRTRTRH